MAEQTFQAQIIINSNIYEKELDTLYISIREFKNRILGMNIEFLDGVNFNNMVLVQNQNICDDERYLHELNSLTFILVIRAIICNEQHENENIINMIYQNNNENENEEEIDNNQEEIDNNQEEIDNNLEQIIRNTLNESQLFIDYLAQSNFQNIYNMENGLETLIRNNNGFREFIINNNIVNNMVMNNYYNQIDINVN
jgi:hypothetical protein